ncbi:synaptic vesicle glycoprotein 2B-like [Anopheles arabiensis]|uniref:Major facilitator superfamily (MFS) profile domain-containing protein n=2 Tax=gambiae species complex TaxID=44542 RepID=A0A182I5G1_ANOAR|nr:synaptic vesicle glycoprotein 2B-like [Anopheles arabiensis]XP_040164601.1 synaptic vesicle glycoprotein 2B-like [Anopheles arabiensis]
MVEGDTDQNQPKYTDVKDDRVANGDSKDHPLAGGVVALSLHEKSLDHTQAVLPPPAPGTTGNGSAAGPLALSKQHEANSGTVGTDPERGVAPIKADFEQAIELTGYGRFHYILLAICGLVSTSEEMDVISMSFILPSAQCDLDLNTQSKGWLNSIIFIGMMFGAYIWGSVADSLGRKKVLIVISIMNAFCIVASSFSQTYEVFMVFRFLNGVALGGSGPVIWPYFAEFQPKSKRGSMLSFMAAFWTIGNLLVAGLAWLIIPTGIGITTPAFTYNSWRIFLLVCSIPSFIVAALLLYLPESPKFLLSQGKIDEALAIFRGIYVTNTGKSKDQYPVRELLIDECLREELEAVTKPIKNKYKRMLYDILDNSKQVFMSPILKFTIISITINFTFHIGYYGLMMWFPELFNRFDEFTRAHPGVEDASVCQVTDYVVGMGSHSQTGVCSATIPSTVFMESLITVAAALPANVVAVLGMDRLGRKFFLVFSTMAAGACSASMYFVTNQHQNLAVSAIFSGVISMGNASLDCLITEVFPTNLRATGVAISMVAARLGGIIGNVVIATLLDLYCPAPTFIVAVLLAGGGLMCLFLPNTTRTALS